jgi:hypothetical protein
MERRAPVARPQHHGVDEAFVGRDGQRSRVLAEDFDRRDPLARRRVVDDDAVVLSRDAHEGAPAREHDVGGLVADWERCDEPSPHRVDHADGVGEVVGDPDLAGSRAHRQAHGLEPDRNVTLESERSLPRHAEDREPGLGGVDGVEGLASRRERDRVDVARLVVDEVARGGASPSERGREHSDEPDPVPLSGSHGRGYQLRRFSVSSASDPRRVQVQCRGTLDAASSTSSRRSSSAEPAPGCVAPGPRLG